MPQESKPSNRRAHAPNAASRQAMKGRAARRDMRPPVDPFAITAPRDRTYRDEWQERYVTRTSEDLYGALVQRPRDAH
jgi:hypothetical protein